ncbi:glycosyltransferase family 4 protein [Paenibacillus sedimenti]|uniref:Glycosyltransferase family 4 protein n=1 Tax=Paenibacillus sedimenti TaxID=2770274 RepID=A0A926KLC6_9BACL|nr:glycosyltransferase family 4 protein [Paenibacillus sedimenti]MBD0379785.1 glycosyltransferase family 4 protein [Paenibacillus sedimenti]
MKKRIVFVANYFYPDFASTGQLLTELCLELQKEFEIVVIAVQPEQNKDKKTRLFEEDYLENIKIVRVKTPEVVKTNKLSRLRFIMAYFILSTFALLTIKKIDTIFTISSPPVLGGLIGTIGKLFKRSKHVYNIQDFNPEQAEAVSYTDKKWVFDIARRIDNWNCKQSDHIIVVGKDMQETLSNRFRGHNVPRSTVINNWTDEKEIIPLSKEHPRVKRFLEEHQLQNQFIVMYSGNLGLYYDLENMIKVTDAFKDEPCLSFVFIGDGAVKKSMQQFIKEKKINNVHFLPFQPKEFIKYSLNAADVHLVVNQKGIKGVSVPSKIYGVMAAGKPVIGVLEQGSEAQRLIEESSCGLVVEPTDYIGIIKSIRTMYEMERHDINEMGIRGRNYLEQHLKKEISITKYKSLLVTV